MELYDAVRAAQIVLVFAGVVACGWFLVLYARIVDWRSPFARFVAALNLLVVTLGVVSALNRLVWPDSLAIEFIRLGLFVVLVSVLGSQIVLLRHARAAAIREALKESA